MIVSCRRPCTSCRRPNGKEPICKPSIVAARKEIVPVTQHFINNKSSLPVPHIDNTSSSTSSHTSGCFSPLVSLVCHDQPSELLPVPLLELNCLVISNEDPSQVEIARTEHSNTQGDDPGEEEPFFRCHSRRQPRPFEDGPVSQSATQSVAKNRQTSLSPSDTLLRDPVMYYNVTLS